MKVPGLELPEVVREHPAPWTSDVTGAEIRDARGNSISRCEADGDCERRVGALAFSAPELAGALVSVTQALVDGLEVHAPGVDPLQHAAVQQALAALAKARGEA